eukprot:scaffold201597_cov37-Prasinocladus_malaysianus.AAC.1
MSLLVSVYSPLLAGYSDLRVFSSRERRVGAAHQPAGDPAHPRRHLSVPLCHVGLQTASEGPGSPDTGLPRPPHVHPAGVLFPFDVAAYA